MPGRGSSRLFHVEHGVWRPLTDWAPNLWLDTWGLVAAKALASRNSGYWINALYVEFQQTEDPVSIPTVSRTDGLDYYEGLLATGDRDYLRLQLVQPPVLEVIPGFEEMFGANEGNQLTWNVLTGGLTGVHGVAWTDACRVCGWATVAAPVWGDRSRDVLFSRSYYAADQQQYKPASGELGISVRLQLATE